MRCNLSNPRATCPVCGFQARRRDGRLVVGAIRTCPGRKPPCGPGCHLKRLLAWAFIKPRPGCRCTERAAQMDSWGPDECERRMDEIVGWLREEAEERGLPFVTAAASAAVSAAIAMARCGELKDVDP